MVKGRSFLIDYKHALDCVNYCLEHFGERNRAWTAWPYYANQNYRFIISDAVDDKAQLLWAIRFGAQVMKRVD